MHYVPESAREFLQSDGRGAALNREEVSFHYRSAPVYLLTALVGGLLAADFLIGLTGSADWLAYRSVWGVRLVLLAALLGSARIIYQSLESLSEGRVGADLALSIAAVAAIVLREYETAGLVVFIALCGESLEGYTMDRAQRAIRRSFQLCPPLAHVLRDQQELELPVEQVEVGDVVLIRPGERIPVDGVVLSGESAVDESPLTGESLPVAKQKHAAVFTGTLNQFGALQVRAQRVGTQTALARITQLIAEATERQAPLERTADRLARLFLPVVLGVAALTLLGWWWKTGAWGEGFRPALTVLVVACPCALVLATPTAVLAAMAWLARTGVVIKSSAVLERLAGVNTFAFDKTGTLTTGELQLATVQALAPLDETELLRTAALAEKQSEHLIARLIVREAERRNCVLPPPESLESSPGLGVKITTRPTVLAPWYAPTSGQDKVVLHVGNEPYLNQQGLAVPEALQPALRRSQAAGETVVLVAVEQQVLGLIGIRDTLRADAGAALGELRQAGIARLALLTGDRAEPAEAVAAAVSRLDEVHSGLLPADKARWIETEQRAGRRVAMVGDGINDAPALAVAAVGIALGHTGSDLAARAGDVLLLGDPLRPLPGLLKLSRRLVANIRQSIFLFAFGVNALGMLLGATGILSPVAGAIFHEIASLAVMFNALRLLWTDLPTPQAVTPGWRDQWAGLAEWLTKTLSPQVWTYRLLGNWSLVLRLGAVGLALYWLSLGVVRIGSDESAFATRGGQYQTELDPGLHWRWPPPFEEIYRARTAEVRVIEIGFRPLAGSPETRPAGPVDWTAMHTDAEPVAEESLILTGDEVPLELTAEVQFQIHDLRAFLRGGVEPEATLRAIAESSLRSFAARHTLDGLLTGQRAEIELACLEEIRRQSADYGLGLKVTSLHLLDLHPPRSVVPAYRDVADALEQQQQQVNEARAYYLEKLYSVAGEEAIQELHGRQPVQSEHWKLTPELWARLRQTEEALAGESARTLHEARQKKQQRVSEATGELARYRSLLEVYQQRENATRWELYLRASGKLLSGRRLTIVDENLPGSRRFILAPAQPETAAPLTPPVILAPQPEEPHGPGTEVP